MICSEIKHYILNLNLDVEYAYMQVGIRKDNLDFCFVPFTKELLNGHSHLINVNHRIEL